MAKLTASSPIRIDYDIDVERRRGTFHVDDTATRRHYRVDLPLHVLPVLRDAINAAIEDNPDLFPHVETMRIHG